MTSFPWWLWLLAGCWAALLVGRWQLARDSEWQRGANVLLMVYTLLLAALAVQRVWIVLPASSTPVNHEWWQILAAVAVLLGGLSAVCTSGTSWEPGGQLACLASLTSLPASYGAYELTLLLVLLCLQTASRRHTSSHQTAPLSAEIVWFVGCLTLLTVVLTMGLLPEIVVQISAVPAAFPDRPAGTLLSWESLLLVGVLVWLQSRQINHRADEKPASDQTGKFSGPVTELIT